jgi:ribosome-associated protein
MSPEPRTIVTNSSAGAAAVKDDQSNPALKRALVAAQTADDNRGRDIVILDLREMTTFFDYFVVVSGTSRRQLHAISEEIDHALEEGMGDRRMGIEGYRESRWILLDYGDVVIHIFEPETRQYYDLENLWGNAKKVPFEPASAKAPETL